MQNKNTAYDRVTSIMVAIIISCTAKGIEGQVHLPVQQVLAVFRLQILCLGMISYTLPPCPLAPNLSV